MISDRKMLEVLLGLCDRKQGEFRRQIALAFPDATEEEVTDRQVEIVNILQRAHDIAGETISQPCQECARKDAILQNPESWMLWCDHRVLEENERLRSRINQLEKGSVSRVR